MRPPARRGSVSSQALQLEPAATKSLPSGPNPTVRVRWPPPPGSSGMTGSGPPKARAVRADPEADDAVGFADVEVVVVEGETVGLAQAVGPDLDLVCDTVTVMDEGRLPYSPFAV